eukprot:COSAG01_NODE_3112_length_6569_cov_90.702318_2_plen_92_part_00
MAAAFVGIVGVATCNRSESKNEPAPLSDDSVISMMARKVASDVACDMCHILAEDLWTTLVADWASNSSSGRRLRKLGAKNCVPSISEFWTD